MSFTFTSYVFMGITFIISGLLVQTTWAYIQYYLYARMVKKLNDRLNTMNSESQSIVDSLTEKLKTEFDLDKDDSTPTKFH